MELFFEQILSRRDFLKRCGIGLTATLFLPRLLKFSSGQESRIGLIKPKKALFYKKLTNLRVRCQLCPHSCIVPSGHRGFCRVRVNKDGEYYTLSHSNPCALHIDPIEKKPLFHFLPGTSALSIATAGCNFTCKNCQNWDISQARPDDTRNYNISPAQLVDIALQYNTRTIAYTYTEPTIFYEYMFDTARIAQKKGINNIYHSNGYINYLPLRKLIPFLDGANIDLKGMNENFYEDITGGTLNPVLQTIKTLKEEGVWLEITNLIIPTKNDSPEMFRKLCRWIKKELGTETPIHFSRFYPLYKLPNLPPTPLKTLRTAASIAHDIGLKYVYIGNVRGIPEENTYCPNCDKIIIERKGYYINAINLKKGRCKFCGHKIPGVW